MYRIRRTLPWLTLLASAGLTVAVQVAGATDLSAMPTPPWWTPLVGAAVAAIGFGLTRSHPAAGSALSGVGAVVLAMAALPRVPHDLLAAMSIALAALTGGRQLFEVSVPWAALAAHLVTLLAAATCWAAAVRGWRVARGRCLRCGAVVGGQSPAGRLPVLRAAAVVAVVAPLPYAALKVAWGLGWQGGLTDPQIFSGVSLTTPGLGDTALLALIGVALAAAMAWPIRLRPARPLLLAGGSLGAVMLLPVGVLGTGQLLVTLVSPGLVIEDAGIAPWVFALVYPSFLVWGVGLAWTTLEYVRVSRPPCSVHPADAYRPPAWVSVEP